MEISRSRPPTTLREMLRQVWSYEMIFPEVCLGGLLSSSRARGVLGGYYVSIPKQSQWRQDAQAEEFPEEHMQRVHHSHSNWWVGRRSEPGLDCWLKSSLFTRRENCSILSQSAWLEAGGCPGQLLRKPRGQFLLFISSKLYLIFPLSSSTIVSLAVLWTVRSWRVSTANIKTPMNRIRLAWRESSDFWRIFSWIPLAGERDGRW